MCIDQAEWKESSKEIITCLDSLDSEKRQAIAEISEVYTATGLLITIVVN